jgi:hypothetical protein
MKKLLATILALVMAIGVTTTAWADGEGTTANVAKIGETGYATLADAIAAAQAGETIVLLADAAINSNTQITRNVAIDLNGKTVTVTTVGSQNAFEVQNGATFTIKDSGAGGKLDLGKFGIMLMNSKLKIEGGEIKVSPANPGAGVVVAAIGDSEVTMTGGKVVATNTACFNAGYFGTQTFNISGGTLESKDASTALMGISNNYGGHTEMTISGDTQVVMKDAAGNAGSLVSDATGNDVIKVVGGTSDSDITAYTEATAPVVLTGDGTYHIGTTAANAAVRNAASGETVTVVKGNAALTDVPVGVTVANNGAGTVTVNGSGAITEGNPYTVPARYYYNSTTTDTKADDTKGSPKTFDAGMGIYAVSALLSVTGMACVGRKKF